MVDLFREWDADKNGQVSKAEFRKAMPLLGFDAPRREVDALFDSWDPDGSGTIAYAEPLPNPSTPRQASTSLRASR